MKAYDFEYDGINLSDKGFIICNFGSGGIDTISNGSQITFNTVSTLGGTKHKLVSTEYEDCLESTIQICKNPCFGNAMEISPNEFRELTKWLSRKKFLKFKILDNHHLDLYFEASFNISRIEFGGELYGLELEVKTNRPYALKEPRTINIDNRKLFMWKQYDVVKDDGYSLNEDTGKTFESSTYVNNKSFKIYKNMIFDETTGAITLSDPLSSNSSNMETISGNYSTYPYYYINNMNNVSGIGKITNIKRSASGSGNVSYTCTYTLYTSTVGYSKGSYMKDIASENANTYPTDGIKNGYYYVYVGEGFLNHSINDVSYEEGYIYPWMEITILEDGDFNIYNDLENRDTHIAGCTAGEIITMDYPVIRSSVESHDIPNNFNWNFFRIANTFDDKGNDLTISLPCKIKIVYSPIVKVGL